MRIGIISDTHDHIAAVEDALDVLRAQDVHTLLHCGDVCSPSVIHLLGGFDVWIAEGNMDRSARLKPAVTRMLGRGRLARLHQLALDGHGVGLLHGDDQRRLHELIGSGKLAYVFHGHTHRREDRQVGRTRVINPGALGGAGHQRRSFCTLELESGEIRFVEL
jgi:hypothetical protein